MKQCPKCQRWLDENQFSPSKQNRTGLKSYCKECHNIDNKQHRLKIKIENLLRSGLMSEETKCTKCGCSRKQKRFKYNICIDCVYNHHKKWLSENYDQERLNATLRSARLRRERPEYIRMLDRRYRENNPDKVKARKAHYRKTLRGLKKHGCSAKELTEWFTSQTKVCLYCGIPCDKDYHVDHMQPISRGGQHTLDNLCIACPTCNLRKNRKTVSEFMEVILEERKKACNDTE